MGISLRGRDLLSVTDLSKEEIEKIWRLADEQKSGRVPREELLGTAPGRTLAMIFDKSSLRTHVGFEVAMVHLGGQAIYLTASDIRLAGMGRREGLDVGALLPGDRLPRLREGEALRDIARVLERMVDAIAARLSDQRHLEELARHAGVPVINAMSDLEHPLQAIADLSTVCQHKGYPSAVEIAWIGDGNNVCHSLMLICAMFGAHLRVATPVTYEPNQGITARARELSAQSGASITFTNDPQTAATGADVIYTDVWVSSGMEDAAPRRIKDFQGFQVSEHLLAMAKPDAIVLHCLPAHRGEEITDEVIESPQFAGFDQAGNRLHTQRALLTLMLG